MGLIPSLVDEDTLHSLIVRWYLSEKTNLDRIYEELDLKKYLIDDCVLNDCHSTTNCNSVYYFVEPVTITFDIDSGYADCKTFKEFHDVTSLSVFALSGNVECRVDTGYRSKSIFLFDDTHKLEFKIESEKMGDD